MAGLKLSMEKQLGWKRPPGDDNDYDCNDIDNENDEDDYQSGEREDGLFDEVDDVWNHTSVMAEPLSCTLNGPLCPIVPGQSLNYTFF